METENTQKSPKSDQSRDEIYLVGFLEAAGAPRAPSISELIQTLVPESQVQIHAPFNDIPDEPPIPDADLEDECDVDETEDETRSLSSISTTSTSVRDGAENATSIHDMAGYAHFSSDWVQSEALSLLNRIRQQCGASVKGKRIILAGHGFGGIVVKQAIVIANTTPRYYSIAQSIARLVFFATPHMSVEHISWQDAMLEMMQDEGTCIYRDELSKRVSDLASSMFQLSHVFYRFASKYPITNFVHGRHADIQQFNSDFETVVPWKQEASSKAMHGAIEDLGICEALRQHFCPLYIPSDSHHSPAYDDQGPASRAFDNLYLDALRMLGPSQWNLDEMKTLDSQRDYHELQKIYASSIHGITLETVRGGSILVIGPMRQDRSAMMKLLLQNIIQNHPIMLSFIHQIISQRPFLFRLVETLMAEMLRLDTWSQQATKNILRSILQQPKSVDFLVLIQDFESWPPEAKSWLSDIPHWFPESSQSTCTFILGCQETDPNLTPGKSIRLDLGKKRKHKQALLANRHSVLPLPFHGHAKNSLISKIKRSQWSLAFTRVNLDRLLRPLSLGSPTAIKTARSLLQNTEEQILEYFIDSLLSGHDVSPRWVKLTLSWAHLAVRPLRIEELAVATAIRMDFDKISDIESAMLKDLQRDLNTHLLGLVTVENRSVFTDNPLIEQVLAKKLILKGEPPGLYGHSDISLFCLKYLRLVLGEESSPTLDQYLAFMSHHHCSEELEHSSFAFLDYACRFWPIHFLQTEAADKDVNQAVIDFLLTDSSKRWFRIYHLLHEACDPSANEAAVEMSERAMRAAAAAAATRRTDAMENLDPTQSAVAMASYVGLSPVVCSLLNVDATDNQLDRCKVRRGCLERVEIFSDLASSHYLDCIISNDDDVAAKDLFNTNPEAATSQFLLHKAAWGGCSKVVHALLGLLDNSAQANDEGRTPLHMAVLCGHLDVVRILVGSDEPTKGGSDDAGRIDMINNQDNDLKSPLIMATELGHVEIAQYLVQSGADLALKDGTGKAAVHYAVLRSTQILKTPITCNKSVMDMRDEND